MTDYLIPPALDQLEVSLFGPGYGEALAVHLGGGRWMLVDSCSPDSSKYPASLAYLEAMGVDITQAVELIVISHWHDDHTRGLAEIVRRCTAARIFASIALTQEDFRDLVNSYRRTPLGTGSGVDEFITIYTILRERAARSTKLPGPDFAIADRCLYNTTLLIDGQPVSTRVWSLSPSGAEVRRALASFSKLMPKEGFQPIRVGKSDPNNTSVALWCALGDHQFMLGADLEKVNDPTRGWVSILDNSVVLPRDSSTGNLAAIGSLFKVSHHGSITGHEPRLWAEVLQSDTWAILTPWNIATNYLPQAQDIDRVKKSTSRAFISAAPYRAGSGKPKFTHGVTNDMYPRIGRYIHPSYLSTGHIRLRCVVTDPPNSWQIELFHGARAL